MADYVLNPWVKQAWKRKQNAGKIFVSIIYLFIYFNNLIWGHEKKTVATEKKRNSQKTNYFFLILLVLTQFSNFFLSDLMKLFKGVCHDFFSCIINI